MSLSTQQIAESLEELPDLVADKLLVWRKATIHRENMDAKAFVAAKEKAISLGGPAGDDFIKAKVKADEEHRGACEVEAAAEVEYVRHYERLMALKRTAGIREAY